MYECINYINLQFIFPELPLLTHYMNHYYRIFDLFPAADGLLEPQQLHRQGVSMETQGFLC